MSAAAALALSTMPSKGAQETVVFTFQPPIGRVMEFATTLEVTDVGDQPLYTVNMVTGQRAAAEGTNFRFTRFVSYVTADGKGAFAKGSRDLNAMAGKTYPVVVGRDGTIVDAKRGKYDNDPGKLPSMVMVPIGPATVGGPIRFGGNLLPNSTKATLREIRPLGTDSVAIVDFTDVSDGVEAKGIVLVSTTDGMVLALDLHGDIKARAPLPKTHFHLHINRQNVTALSVLASTLGIGD